MTDLFNDDKSTDFAAYLPGDQGRYKTVEDLAKGKYESDLHIKNIERENAELRQTNLSLREDNQTKAQLAEYIDRLTKAKTAQSQPALNDTNLSSKSEPFNPKEIESLFDKRIKEYEITKTREQNAKSVVDVLKERYGHNYLDVLNKQTEELGLSKEAVNYLAETAPKAFFKTLGLDQAPITDPFQAPPRRTSQFTPKGEPTRSWSYYQDMKKNNPRAFNDPKIQQQMENDYMRLGKAFEDGDFLAYGQPSAI